MCTDNTHLRLFFLGLGLVGVIALATLAAFWWLTGEASLTTLRIWAIVATLTIAPSFAGGWYLGKIEARGYIRGTDHTFARVVDLVQVIAPHRSSPVPAVASEQPVLIARRSSAVDLAPPSVVLDNGTAFALIAQQTAWLNLGQAGTTAKRADHDVPLWTLTVGRLEHDRDSNDRARAFVVYASDDNARTRVRSNAGSGRRGHSAGHAARGTDAERPRVHAGGAT